MEYQNLPAEFVARMQSLLGDEWEAFSASLQSHNYQALRWNVQKARLTAKEQRKRLETVGIREAEAVPWAENGWYYTPEAQPGKHPYHEMGMYYIQEPSAMSAAALLHPIPGERVLDLCAAPGGKSTQLAACLDGQGLLIANEIHAARCKILSQNIERMGIANAIVTNEDSAALAARFPEYFHSIQVDAPCSGEGMFRKNPEAIQEWSPDHVKLCADRQLEILENAAAMLMPGGRIVYSTCTFAPEENEMLIARFLLANPDFALESKEVKEFDAARPEWIHGCQMGQRELDGESGSACAGAEIQAGEKKQAGAGYMLEGEKATASGERLAEIETSMNRAFRLWPHHLHGEGHFAAILRKEGEIDPDTYVNAGKKEPETHQPSKKRSGKGSEPWRMDAGQSAALQAFLEETLETETGSWILSGRLILFGEQLYRLPEGAPSLERLRVLRPGLHVGTFKKNRFEPSHALALYLAKEQVKNVLDLPLSDERVAAYFRGETVGIGAEIKKGWCLICVDGCSAGWGKAADGQIKNHYPKGLRKYA